MLITEHYKHHAIQIDDLILVFYYMEATGYSLAHNRIPMVPLIEARLPKEAESDSPACEITLQATVGSAQLFSTRSIEVPGLKPGQGRFLETFDLTRVPVSETLESTASRPGDLEFFVNYGGTSLSDRVDIEVLAPNEWFNSEPYFESLCAYIQPNSPSVIPLLDKTSAILQARTDSASLDGYQGGPDRVLAISAAIYEALQDSGIRYINPPASFEETGQRIRSSSEVLETRFGTCVDLSLTFAAVAEQCGLHPVIIIVPGHALTGILMTQDPLPSPVIYEPTVINNYLRSGRLLPIDAAFYSEEDFADTIEKTRKRLSETRLIGLIDVVGSHRDGIRPLPESTTALSTSPTAAAPAAAPENRCSSALADSATTTISDEIGESLIEETPSTTATQDTSHDEGETTSDPEVEEWKLPTVHLSSTEKNADPGRHHHSVDRSPSRVQKWKTELLDLTLRNRLLNMKSNAEVLPIFLPDGALADLDDKIHAGTKVSIHPEDDVSDNRRLQGVSKITELPREQVLDDLASHNRVYAALRETGYSRYLKNLVRAARTYLEETGSTNLHLALGELVHTTEAGGSLAPRCSSYPSRSLVAGAKLATKSR